MIVGAAGLTSFVGEAVGLALVLIVLGSVVHLVVGTLVAGWRALRRPGQVVVVMVGGVLALTWLLGVLAPRPIPRSATRVRGPSAVLVVRHAPGVPR